jgi:hypothetical protein
MKRKTLLAVLWLALAAGCGGGGGSSGNTSNPSDAFVAGVQAAAVTQADDSEPQDVSTQVEAVNDDSEAIVVK